MVSRLLCVAGAIPLILALTSGRAAACGGFFTEVNSTEVAAMSDIRVVLVQGQGQVTQFVQVAYSGKATRFAWIYPVPSLPEVAEDKNDIFARLEEVTRPRITIYTPHGSSGGGGFGCGAADDAAGLDGGRQANPPVQVWQSGTIGAFDYAVVSASVAQDLLDWLNQNGFAVPATTGEVVGHYLAQGWMFVAMKLSVEATASGAVPSTTTVRFTYSADEVRYPLKMVSLSPAASTSVEFYLVSSATSVELAPTAPFSALTIDGQAVVATAPDAHNYEAVFDATRAKAGPRGLVREFSDVPWDHVGGIPAGSVVTRLRTTFNSDAMDQDIVFVEQPHSLVTGTYQLYYDENAEAAAPPLLILIALLARLRLRRRPR